ncbi:SIR2 family protein [Streptomyces sp. BE303]|uniref:SIR2 family protein n=1 Tax=Streptomyces sp. BE303 TaxID=3002528 RepID=UPI002E76973E|nr:SIR2 family protein [Streptomyces sp. BE303]MED7949316.1 SIR2 family protein [Streptomyces sp. BE303]
MLSAWGVQNDLILQLAAVEGAEVPETDDGPFEWYETRFGQLPAYDALLAGLAKTQSERQALLRSYFEPDEAEREQGLKRPTDAHRALARLVASGHIRVIITLNFDHLIEHALRDVGLNPTVISKPSDLAGMLPLHAQRQGVVVHLHGDYLDPASMRNTPEELREYEPEVNRFLDQVFDEYGLIIAGWSATYDPALCDALKRCATRRFATYWADPFPLSTIATAVLNQRQATYIKADADSFLGQTADAVTVLSETNRRNPNSIAIAVATAKRELGGDRPAINLHDALRRETARITNHSLRSESSDVPAMDVEDEHQRRLTQWESTTETLLALVAVTAYWGTDATDRYWFRDIERLADIQPQTGSVALNDLHRAPATMLLYSAGVAAVAAERWPLVARLLTVPRAKQFRPINAEKSAAVLLGPQTTMGLHDSASRLHHHLKPILTDHLVISGTAYTEAWERFEYLRLIVQQDSDKAIEKPYLRVTGTRGAYRPLASYWLTREFGLESDSHLSHPLEISGLLDADLAPDRVIAAQQGVDNFISQWVDQINSTTGQFIRSGPFYPNDYH